MGLVIEFWAVRNEEMKNGKIKFKGSFGEFFWKSLLLIIASPFTLGISWLYWLFWMMKFFARNSRVVLDDRSGGTQEFDGGTF